MTAGPDLEWRREFPEGWAPRSIEEMCSLVTSGGTPKRSAPEYFVNGTIPWVKTGELNDGYVVTTEEALTESALAKSAARVLPVDTVLMAMYGATVGALGILAIPAACNQASCAMVAERSRCDARWLFYALLNDRPRIVSLATGAAQQNLSGRAIRQFVYAAPTLPEQRAIAEVLGALDDKIAANTRLVALGSEQLDVDFARSLARKSRLVELGVVAEFHNRRRVPLSSRERDGRSGSIPYYGASGVFGWVDEAIFDDRLLLVGEDGSVITEDRHPVTQYIWGPSWVNNHAHVLSGRGLTTEMLYLAVRRADVSTLVTGAVQPKISMGNLKRLEIRLPGPSEAAALQERVDAWFGIHRALTAENLTLAATRDALLPPLMSGVLRVRDAEHLAETLT